MSDTTIRPALTPEEWEEPISTAVGTCPKVGIRARVWLRPRMESDNVRREESHVVKVEMYPGRSVEVLDEEDRLRMAALCLHGHPQGFTCADVRMARRLASYRQISMRERMMQAQYGGDAEAVNRARNEAMGGDQGGFSLSPKYREWLESLAARIEALLPPEGA